MFLERCHRVYYDDGTPLGSSASDECRIDSIAQSWSHFGAGDPARQAQAMRSLERHVVREDVGILESTAGAKRVRRSRRHAS